MNTKTYKYTSLDNIKFVFSIYLSILLLISFIYNSHTFSFEDPLIFFQQFGGDSYKFARLAKESLGVGFICPITHCPGLQSIDIILLWIHSKFPIIIFLTLLNDLLWAVLLTLLYFFGRDKTNKYVAFIMPLFLLIPDFSNHYFLRSLGIPLGTSFSAVSLNIALILFLISMKRNIFLLSIFSGLALTFSGYIWSFSDSIIIYISFAYVFVLFLLIAFTAGYFFTHKLTVRDLATQIRASSSFQMLLHSFIPLLIFWITTLPYRLYVKSFTMVPSEETWQRIWKLPLYWNDAKYANNWLFRGGGFPFCRAYPDICEKLHLNINIHNDISSLKLLTLKVFLSDPLTVIKWKLPYFISYWYDHHKIQNLIIFLFIPFILMIFLKKPNKYTSSIVFFCSCVSFCSLTLLFFHHIEHRYLYIAKFTLCVGFLLSLYAYFKPKDKVHLDF